MRTPLATTITHLECSRCGKTRTHERLENLCACGGPHLVRYDLKKAALTLNPEALGMRGPIRAQHGSTKLTTTAAPLGTANQRPMSMWRYAEILPAREAVTLGEGMTPLVPAERLGAQLGLRNLFIKDEGLNPTGSFKARGLSAAVSKAKELGAKILAMATAGNAGGALAAYAARAGLCAVVVMPADTPRANVMEAKACGAELRQLDGLISDCAKYVAERKEKEGWFEVTTLKEPYRIEGKKTMAYELWEDFQGRLPDVIVYPTGGGVGLIGMWKAFEEMEEMSWMGSERPRMVAVQASGCAPIVRAFEAGAEEAAAWENAVTIAAGLRVPRALGDRLMLRALRESRGTAVAVSDEEILAAGRELAASEGIFAAPEGAAGVAAIRVLRKKGWLRAEETVVLFNTGSGYKYSEAWEKALKKET